MMQIRTPRGQPRVISAIGLVEPNRAGIPPLAMTSILSSPGSMIKDRPMSQHSRHYLGLDGLRGIVAFVVVFLHGTLLIDNVAYTPDAACLAVDFFFLLSGFVIAHAYDRRLQDGMTFRQFMTVRLIRLYPMLFVGTGMGGLLFVLSQFQRHQFDILTALVVAIGSFVLLPVGLVVGTIAYPVNVAAWSLFFEFAVNTLYGSRLGRLSNRNLVLLVAVSGISVIPMAIWGGPYIRIGFGTPATFLLGFVRVSYPFWVGVLLFRVVQLQTMPRVPFAIICSTLTLLLLAPINSPVYNIVLVLLVFPVIVASAACASFGNLAASVCSFLGRLSYPLYLVHVPVFVIINRMSNMMMHLGSSPWALVMSGSVLSAVVAETLLVIFDEPLRRRLSFRMRGKRNSRLDQASAWALRSSRSVKVRAAKNASCT
jgi:peptidoglycan/LPS O-acetylase OafA/YrhL